MKQIVGIRQQFLVGSQYCGIKMGLYDHKPDLFFFIALKWKKKNKEEKILDSY